MLDDEHMRTRLQTLAERERLPHLTPSQRLRAERDAHARHRLHVLSLRLASWSAAAFGAVALLVLGLRGRGGEDLPADDPLAEVAHCSAAASPDVAAQTDTIDGRHAGTRPRVAVAAACLRDESWSDAGDGRRLDLGARALLLLSAGAAARGGLASDCETSVLLERGRLQVHARDLAGRGLHVETLLGRVSVVGTIFEVEVDPEAGLLSVLVDEGTVRVTTPDEDAQITAGARWTRSAGSRVALRARVPDSARRALRSALGLSSAAPSSPRTAGATDPATRDAAPSDTPRVWHQGAITAPEEGPEPKSSVTEDGRPMSKPRVVERRGSEP